VQHYAASGSIMLHSVAAFNCNQPEHKKHKESLLRSSILLGVEKGACSPLLHASKRCIGVNGHETEEPL
jgi:hypothetical protein